MKKENFRKNYAVLLITILFLSLNIHLVFGVEPINPVVKEETALFKNVLLLKMTDFREKEFDTLVFLPDGPQQGVPGTLLSLGYYELPLGAGVEPGSYLWQVGRWTPRITELLGQGYVVMVPDTTFVGSYRADALWACAQYLRNELGSPNVFVVSGSAGGGGAIRLLEEPEYMVDIDGYFPENSNWTDGQLNQDKISAITCKVIFYAAGNEDGNSKINGFSLFMAIDRFNPTVTKDFKIYGPNAGHGFFTEDTPASEEAKTEIYLIMDSIVKGLPLPSFFDGIPDKPEVNLNPISEYQSISNSKD